MHITDGELAGLSYADLSELNKRVIKFMRRKRNEVKGTFGVGDEVTFYRGSRRGGWGLGTVVKINKKSYSVLIHGEKNPWRVPKHLVMDKAAVIVKDNPDSSFMEDLQTM